MSDSGWKDEVMGSLSAVPKAGLEPEQRAAFEDLLFTFVRILNEIVGENLQCKLLFLKVQAGGAEVADDLVSNHNAASVCQVWSGWMIRKAFSQLEFCCRPTA